MIDFIGVGKSFGGRDLLKQVTFRINPGDRVGIVGPNGAGKSTIFRMLTGEESRDCGAISIPRQLRIGYLHQELMPEDSAMGILDFASGFDAELAGFHRELAAIEEAMQAPDHPDRERLLARHGELQSAFEDAGGYLRRTAAGIAMSGLGFAKEDFERPLREFSGGWKMRAALAHILISDPELLMLDEPSNYLDIPAVEWLCRFLKSYSGTLMLISHDRYLLNMLTNVTLEVNSGLVTRFAGNYDFYMREREERFRSLAAARRNQERERQVLERNIERFRAKSTKAAQAKSWQKALDRMEEIVVPGALDFKGALRLPPPPESGAEAIRLENVTFAYPGMERPLLRDVDLAVNAGEKIAFIGYNGTGKTTLLKLMAGKLKPLRGKITPGHKVVIGYQAQDFAEILCPGESVYDTVRAACSAEFPSGNIPNVLGSFGFSAEAMQKPVEVLSGGEKIRLCFARIFVNPPNLLLLDEPTTHLDIAAREALQQVLRNYRGTVCLVSHDVEFVRNVADTIIAMLPGGIRKYFGNYDYYLEKTAAEPSAALPENKPAPAASDSARDRRRERAEIRRRYADARKKLQLTIAEAEKKLDLLSAERDSLLEDLNCGRVTDFRSARRRIAEIEVDTAAVTSRWEDAAVKLEELEEQLKSEQSA